MSDLGYIIKEIPLTDIIFPVEEMRSQISFEGLDELSRSIRKVGLLNPISVRPKDDKFELIAGYRRTKACEMAGLATVPARIFNSTDDIADLQKAHENLFREEVNALDEGSYYKLLIEKHNWTLQDLAAAVHKSDSYVSRRMKLVGCPDDVKQALQDRKINLSVAEELIKIPDLQARARLLYLVIANGATVDIVRTWRVQYEIDNNFRKPPIYVGTEEIPAGTPGDPNSMGNLTDDKGAMIQLTESVEAYRVCHACLNKTLEKDARLLILCPTCAGAIESFLPGSKEANAAGAVKQ
jgi:ParB family chromosome partitioning protein